MRRLFHNGFCPHQHRSPVPHSTAQMAPHELDQAMHSHIHSPQAQMPVDPSLQIYYPAYSIFQQEQSQPQPHQAMQAQLNASGLSPQVSSPHTPEYTSTPSGGAIASPYQSNPTAKRSPSSSVHNGIAKHRKKLKRDDKDEDLLSSPSVENCTEGKVKATRGSRFVLSFFILITKGSRLSSSIKGLYGM